MARRESCSDFPNVKSTAPDEIAVGRGPVSVVHVATSGSTSVPTTRVTIDLMRPATYRVIPPDDFGRTYTILLEEEAAALVMPPAPAATTPGSNTVAALDPINALLSRSAAGPARGTGPLAQAPQGATPQLPASAPAQGAQPRFTGHPVSLEFESADLRTVLRTFANISGLNIVIDQSVQGAVDVSLHEVPWDQALDIILRDHKLGYSVDGTIVRIAPLAVLADEEGQRRKLAEERALAGELELLTRPLSYAKAAELTPLLTRTALSSRGDIQVDPRTNTIIIRDLASRLQGASALIDSLDRPQPQVEIEARIIQTTRDYARKLGVQWGFNGRVAPDLGNTTGLAFPNQGAIGGRTGGVAGQPVRMPTSTAVDLGVNTASSAIGLALGSVNGAFNLDVVLTALEESGNGRILSTPRVATQNNVPAEITQGVQIPIQTVANNTVTVSFRDAALKLNVTPQITAANTVIMSIVLENSSPDFSRAVTGIPPINTQRAVTSLLVSDGQTSVIGGIYINSRDSSIDRVPRGLQDSASGLAVPAARADRRDPRAADLHHAAHHQGLAMGKGRRVDMRAVIRSGIAGAAVAVALAGSISCGDVARTGKSPSMIVIDSLQAASGADPGSLSGFLLSDVVTLVEQTINGETVQSADHLQRRRAGDVAVDPERSGRRPARCRRP